MLIFVLYILPLEKLPIRAFGITNFSMNLINTVTRMKTKYLQPKLKINVPVNGSISPASLSDLGVKLDQRLPLKSRFMELSPRGFSISSVTKPPYDQREVLDNYYVNIVMDLPICSCVEDSIV